MSEDVHHKPPSRPMSDVQSGLRLDELLREVQQRLAEIVATRGRMQGLLDAVLAVADGVELDTTLQRIVGDVFLGRVFSIYDVLLNVALVVATVIAALVMPADGRSIAVLAGASLWYLAIAVVVIRFWPRPADRLVTERVH